MFCTQCGKQLADTARFCTACGKPTTSDLPPAASARKLRRIVGLKKVAGVCAGFAEYFGTDLTLMRVIWVALLLLPPHIGFFAYFIAWFVLPAS